jgi:hypothetical protein
MPAFLRDAQVFCRTSIAVRHRWMMRTDNSCRSNLCQRQKKMTDSWRTASALKKYFSLSIEKSLAEHYGSCPKGITFHPFFMQHVQNRAVPKAGDPASEG